MKKILLLLIALFIFGNIAKAQITQAASDKIVLDRMSTETRVHTIYAKENLQEGMTIATTAGEILELDYSCWVYFILYDDNAYKTTETAISGLFLIVKENNGSLLQINPTGDAIPDNLTEWKIVYQCEFDNPLTDLPWLKEIIDEFENEAKTLGYNSYARIYQCNYKNGTGFLLQMCEECLYVFRNCEGTVLCDSSNITEMAHSLIV